MYVQVKLNTKRKIFNVFIYVIYIKYEIYEI